LLLFGVPIDENQTCS